MPEVSDDRTVLVHLSFDYSRKCGEVESSEDGVDSQSMYERSDPDWRYRTYGPETITTRTQAYTIGTLVIDVFEVERKALVWRGVGEGQTRQDQDAAKQEARINEAVRMILAEFRRTG